MTRARERLTLAVATCFGLGYSPIFPGTCGALIGIVIFVPIALCGPPSVWQTVAIGAAWALSCWVTIALGSWAERYFQEKDSGIFVTDEVAGFLFTVLLFWWPFVYEFNSPASVWLTVAWGFPITRVIDIIKVPPAKKLEKLPAGWGVVADDLLGSVYAAAVLHVLAALAPGLFAIGTG